jgi:hypothetical protein
MTTVKRCFGGRERQRKRATGGRERERETAKIRWPLGVWDEGDSGKWFMLVRSVNYFMLGKCYLSWSTEKVFSLIKNFSHPKHLKFGENALHLNKRALNLCLINGNHNSKI